MNEGRKRKGNPCVYYLPIFGSSYATFEYGTYLCLCYSWVIHCLLVIELHQLVTLPSIHGDCFDYHYTILSKSYEVNATKLGQFSCLYVQGN